MMKIHLSNKVDVTFKEFASTFKSKFKHLPEDQRKKAMKAEYDRAKKARGPIKE